MTDTLTALSDVLVVRALERACNRGLARTRWTTGTAVRHRAYERLVIPPERIDHALEDAWCHLPELAERHRLPIDPRLWARALDGYVRDLLDTRQPHTLPGLELALQVAHAYA